MLRIFLRRSADFVSTAWTLDTAHDSVAPGVTWISARQRPSDAAALDARPHVLGEVPSFVDKLQVELLVLHVI